MTYQSIRGVRVWGDPDEKALEQAVMCRETGDVLGAALMADHHLGYSMPIGGVVAYRDAVSPSGVGYDIACGILAVKTDLTLEDTPAPERLGLIADEINRRVAFGLGRTNPNPVDHALFESPAWSIPEIRPLKQRAEQQLGTVGSGNHFVDVLAEVHPVAGEEGTAYVYEPDSPVWVAAHFGSRGLGHKIASGYLNVAAGREFDDRKGGTDGYMTTPTLIPAGSALADDYRQAMSLAGDYAYAGREYVIGQVLEILGAEALDSVHNHHNYAWQERHEGEDVWVVRKGATPAWPGQRGFVGGSMGDVSAIVRGVDTPEADASYHSTVHGAGRVMSRGQAKGNRKGTRPGLITREMMDARTRHVTLRGGDVDESPHVYRPLATVLDAHAGNLDVETLLMPLIVVMAGHDVRDPFKD